MSDAARRYVVGLGANLGDRLATLQSAVAALRDTGTVRAVSALYESPAVGPPQPDYLNAAVLLESGLTPRDLLDHLFRIERAHGRERRERWGARTLDLDLLFSPGLTLREDGLTLPHPELSRRAFALAPLLDVTPDACEPASGVRYEALFAGLGPQGLRRIESAENWCPGRAE